MNDCTKELAQLAKLPDSALVVTRLSRDCESWYAVMALPKENYVGDPDFSTCRSTEAKAITDCATKIREAMKSGRYGPYTFIYRYLATWKERAKAKAPTNLDPSRTVMYDPKVNDTKWGLIREANCGYIEGSGEAIFKEKGWEDMLEGFYASADATINSERRVHEEFERLRSTHKVFQKTFIKFLRPRVLEVWLDMHGLYKHGQYTAVDIVTRMLAQVWIEQSKLEAKLS